MGKISISETLELINAKLAHLEKKILELDEKLDRSTSIQKNHLIRVKNNEDISDDLIYSGKPYNDLAPEKAYALYLKKDADYFMLDVSLPDYTPFKKLPETNTIPLEELGQRLDELINHTSPILIISEDGTRSIKACELLVEAGYFNVNNVSGGYKFWPGFLDS